MLQIQMQMNNPYYYGGGGGGGASFSSSPSGRRSSQPDIFEGEPSGVKETPDIIEASKEFAVNLISNHIFGIPVSLVKRDLKVHGLSSSRSVDSSLTKRSDLVFYHSRDIALPRPSYEEYLDDIKFVRPAKYSETIKAYVVQSLHHGMADSSAVSAAEEAARELAGDCPLLSVVNQITHSDRLKDIEQTLDDLYAQYAGGLRAFYPDYMTMGLSNYSFATVLAPELKRLKKAHHEHRGFMRSLHLTKTLDPVNDDYIRQCLHQVITRSESYQHLVRNTMNVYSQRFDSDREQLESHILQVFEAGVAAGVWEKDSSSDGDIFIRLKIAYESLTSEVLGHKTTPVTYMFYTLHAAHLLGVEALTFSDLIETNIMSMMRDQQQQQDPLSALLSALQRLHAYGYVRTTFAGWSLTYLGHHRLEFSSHEEWSAWFNNNVSTYGTLGLTSGPRDLDIRVQVARTIDPSMIAEINRVDGTIIFRSYTREWLLAGNQERNRYRAKPVPGTEADLWIQSIHELQHTIPTSLPPLPRYSRASAPSPAPPYSETSIARYNTSHRVYSNDVTSPRRNEPPPAYQSLPSEY